MTRKWGKGRKIEGRKISATPQLHFPAINVPAYLIFLSSIFLSSNVSAASVLIVDAGFCLQTTPAITGTFTNLSGATSPYTNPLTAAQQFFRLKKN
jgi:hypothetical protein